jgi:hypothetical protein
MLGTDLSNAPSIAGVEHSRADAAQGAELQNRVEALTKVSWARSTFRRLCCRLCASALHSNCCVSILRSCPGASLDPNRSRSRPLLSKHPLKKKSIVFRIIVELKFLPQSHCQDSCSNKSRYVAARPPSPRETTKLKKTLKKSSCVPPLFLKLRAGAGCFLNCVTMSPEDADIAAASLHLTDPTRSSACNSCIHLDVYGDLARAASGRSVADVAAAAGRATVIMFFHGGGFAAGDKSQCVDDSSLA